jgi:hypothetical protein
MKKICNIIMLVFVGNITYSQTKTTDIKFNSPCFKSFIKTNRNVNTTLENGYECEFVFIPDVYITGKTGKIYYGDWWDFFISKKGNYIDIYPLKDSNVKAHIRINQLTDKNEVLYTGKIETIHRKDYEVKYNTDEWQIDTLSQQVKITRNRTFKYNTELVTVINIEGWDLYVPKKCKTVEGYSLVYSDKRGFVGSYVYFFSKENNEAKASSFSFIGDQKLKDFMKKKELIYYFGSGIWFECNR